MEDITKQIQSISSGLVRGPADNLMELTQDELMYLMYDAQITHMMQMESKDPVNAQVYEQQISALTTGLSAIRPAIKVTVIDEDISDYLLAKAGLPGNPGIQIIQEAYVKKLRGK